MAPYLLERSDSADSYATPPVSTPVYIVGFTLAGLLVISATIWIALRQKRAEQRGTAFLNVRGVMRETDEPVNHFLSGQPATFPVIFPEKVVVPRTSNTARPSRHDNAILPSTPQFPPGLHSRSSSRSSSPSQARPVRQLFQPVLPDELSLSRVGDHLHVLESFDDGWCLVAQNNLPPSRSSLSFLNPSRFSTRVESSGENVQLGLVPAWVFIKPMKGMRVERPVRSSSAGVLQAGLNAPESRDAVISWSNFS
ncbi:uncharacterized protein EDB91DRAFT_1148681 [Suillus paluster]|uniref:uncharacterized protein n=1 Tax=Suillus paluster TaxID=48578 RepID=UPI001B880C56|nr:uncharacterized protein EDB91DRAFT_1148681 [Suillus paluster]KAG1733652.1 hypothetical protein EDB91DRAFT_1148681 [Suillus paluster]